MIEKLDWLEKCTLENRTAIEENSMNLSLQQIQFDAVNTKLAQNDAAIEKLQIS